MAPGPSIINQQKCLVLKENNLNNRYGKLAMSQVSLITSPASQYLSPANPGSLILYPAKDNNCVFNVG